MDEVIKAKRQQNQGSGTRAITIRASRERYMREESVAAHADVVRRCHVKRFLVNVRLR